MRAQREPDVIDVNRRWSVWVGNLRHGYNIGSVQHADYRLARQAAAAAFPNTRIGFIQEERW